jgi:hypothetical protein
VLNPENGTPTICTQAKLEFICGMSAPTSTFSRSRLKGSISRLPKFMVFGSVWQSVQIERSQVLLLISGILRRPDEEHTGLYDEESVKTPLQKTVLKAEISLRPY